MEKDELLDDRFIRELIRNSPLESPSEDFIGRVMAGIPAQPAAEPVSKPFFLHLKSALPYIGLAAMVLVFVFSSDIPFGKFMPGNDYFSRYFLPFLNSLSGGFKSLFSSRFVTFAMGIALSAGFLVLVEHLFSRRGSINHPVV